MINLKLLTGEKRIEKLVFTSDGVEVGIVSEVVQHVRALMTL